MSPSASELPQNATVSFSSSGGRLRGLRSGLLGASLALVLAARISARVVPGSCISRILASESSYFLTRSDKLEMLTSVLSFRTWHGPAMFTASREQRKQGGRWREQYAHTVLVMIPTQDDSSEVGLNGVMLRAWVFGSKAEIRTSPISNTQSLGLPRNRCFD